MTLLAFGCSGHPPQTTSHPLDKWVVFPPASLGPPFEWDQVPDERVFTVVQGRNRQAALQLQDESVLELSKEQFAYYTGVQQPPKGDYKPYLIRGVMVMNVSGHYEVLFKMNAVWVDYSCLGSGSSISRAPIVVFLSRIPECVYVSYGCAA